MPNPVTNANLEQELRVMIADILEMQPDELDPKAHFVKDLGMDSMTALEILACVEKKYRISIPEDLLPQFTNFEKTVEIVTRILKEQS